jgi:predicted nuclease with TOPRIM domain
MKHAARGVEFLADAMERELHTLKKENKFLKKCLKIEHEQKDTLLKERNELRNEINEYRKTESLIDVVSEKVGAIHEDMTQAFHSLLY